MSDHTAAPVPMTEEQKFFFDLQGWILLPSVLSEGEVKAMKAEVYDGARQSYQGALQELLDHPAVAGILTELLAEEPFLGDDYHSFRCEGSFVTVRHAGWKSDGEGTGLPHVVRPPQQANACATRSRARRSSPGSPGSCGSSKR